METQARMYNHGPEVAPARTAAERAMVLAIREYLNRRLSGGNRIIANDIVDSGVRNADDTVFREKARARHEWSDMFVATVEGALTWPENRNLKAVQAAFTAINIKG